MVCSLFIGCPSLLSMARAKQAFQTFSLRINGFTFNLLIEYQYSPLYQAESICWQFYREKNVASSFEIHLDIFWFKFRSKSSHCSSTSEPNNLSSLSELLCLLQFFSWIMNKTPGEQTQHTVIQELAYF